MVLLEEERVVVRLEEEQRVMVLLEEQEEEQGEEDPAGQRAHGGVQARCLKSAAPTPVRPRSRLYFVSVHELIHVCRMARHDCLSWFMCGQCWKCGL